MPYKQVFSQLYPASSAHLLDEHFFVLADGRLSIQVGGTAEQIDIETDTASQLSDVVMAGKGAYRRALSPDGRFRLELDFFQRGALTEYWLIHTDVATGRVRRIKLNTELPGPSLAAPRVTVSPGGSFFLVDDSGVIRLYSAAHLTEVGVFEVAFPHTENAVIALAVTTDDRLIAALSLWKDIVIYDVERRRVAFVRQIRDALGWYDPHPAQILLVGNADAIVSAGASQDALSVNAFQFVPLSESGDDY